MADARRVRAERRAVQVMVTASVGPGTRHHYTGAKTVATDPTTRKLQASFVHHSMQWEGCTAMVSSSHACLEKVNVQVVLLMARELLHCRPADAGHYAWMACITQLVTAAGEAQAPSHPLCPHRPVTKRRLREHRLLLLHVATMTSSSPACAKGTHHANHHRAPKKKETTTRSSSTRHL
ncbi:hypothetical protein D1007_56463 [Hordeum vulgare]|nr:hypothetical protein D1007_56463 [Hordeum vulgare]